MMSSIIKIRDIGGDSLTVDTSKTTALDLFPGAVAVIDTGGVWTPDANGLRQLRDACDAVLSKVVEMPIENRGDV
jgi:hypothetical protein